MSRSVASGFKSVWSTKLAQSLAVPPASPRMIPIRDAPAILSERLTFATGDEPLIFDEAYMPGDRVVISADRYTNELTMRYSVFGKEVGADHPLGRHADSPNERRPG